MKQFHVHLNKAQETGHITHGESCCSLTSDQGMAPLGTLAMVSKTKEATLLAQLCLPLILFLWAPIFLGLPKSHFHCHQAEKTSSSFYRGGPEAQEESGASAPVLCLDQECTLR